MGYGVMRMKAQLTTNVPGGLSTYNRPSLIAAAYKTHATQDYTFHHILANSRMSKRISSYPNAYNQYMYLKAKYGKFTQQNIRG